MKYILLLFGILSASIAFPQSKSATKQQAQNQLPKPFAKSAEERFYLFTDHTFYYPGDSIWYAAFASSATNLYKKAQSELLTLELKDPKQNSVLKTTIILNNGITTGNVKIPYNWPGGLYQLALYSNASKADSVMPIFKKEITVFKEQKPTVLLKLEYEKRGYQAGDWVQATFTAKNLSQIPISETEILVNWLPLDKESTKYVTDKNGEVKIKKRIPADFKAEDLVLGISFNYRGVTEGISKAAPLLNSNYNIEFYPEGGDLIANFNNVVGFYAQDINGKSLDLTGTIISQKGKIVASINSYFLGRGVFNFTPEVGEQYVFKTYNGETFPLPAVQNNGWKISVSSMASNQVSGKIIAQERGKVKVVALQRNQVIQQAYFTVSNSENDFQMQLPENTQGVVVLSLFTEQGFEASQRLIFVKSANQVNAEIILPKNKYIAREQVRAALKVSDKNGLPMASKFAVSVVEEKRYSYANSKQADIFAAMLLEPDLNSNVEEPYSYFNPENLKADSALANLMLSAGWRRVNWRNYTKYLHTLEVPNPTKKEINLLVKDYNSGRKVPNVKFSNEAGLVLGKTNLNGELLIADIDLSKPLELFTVWEGKRRKLTVYQYGDFEIITPNYSDSYAVYNQRASEQSNFIGLVIDNQTKESIPFANVVLKKGNQVITGSSTNIDGNFTIEKLNPGVYDITVTYVGYQSFLQRNYEIKAGITHILTIYMKAAEIELSAIEVIDYNIPLITRDPPSGTVTDRAPIRSRSTPTEKIVTREAITALPTRDVNSIAATAAGVFQADVGSKLQMRGSRTDGTEYFVDGIRTRETPNFPSQAIEQTTVITGGKPAQYGDSFSGAFNIVSPAYSSSPAPIVHPYGWSSDLNNRTAPVGSVYFPKVTYPKLKYKPTDQVSVRNDFRPTLFFGANLFSSTKGNTPFNFYCSDEESSFKIIIEGIAEDGTVFKTTKSFSASPAIAFSAKIPNQLYLTDTLFLQCFIENKTDEIQTPGIFFDDKKLFQLNKRIQNIKLEPGEKKMIEVQMIASKITSASEFVYGFALNGNIEEKKQTIQIKPGGFKVGKKYASDEKEVSNLYFDLRNAIPGTEEVGILLAGDPVKDALKGIESIVREPYGCFEQVSSSSYPNILVMDYLQQSGQNFDNPIYNRAYAATQNAFEKLKGYETSSGGFDLYGRAPGDVLLSAFGILQFADMKRIANIGDDRMMDRSIKWLLKKVRTDGYYDETVKYYSNQQNEVRQAYISYAIAKVTGKLPDAQWKTLETNAFKLKDPYIISWYILTAQALKKDNKGAIALLQNLQNEDGSFNANFGTIKHSYGISRGVEATSVAIEALHKSNFQMVRISEGLKFIAQNRTQYGGFGSTLATVHAIKTIMMYTKANSDKNANGNLDLVDQNKKPLAKFAVSSTADAQTYYLDPSKTRGKELNFNSCLTGFQDNRQAIYFATWNTKLPPSNKSAMLTLSSKLQKSSMKLGETQLLNITLQNKNEQQVLDPMIIIPIPSGLNIDPHQLNKLIEDNRIGYYERTDNAIFLYLRKIDAKEKLDFALSVKAEYTGTFTSDAAQAYPYYGQEFTYWTAGLDIQILP